MLSKNDLYHHYDKETTSSSLVLEIAWNRNVNWLQISSSNFRFEEVTKRTILLTTSNLFKKRKSLNPNF